MQFPDRLGRGEAGDEIADMAALEIGEGKPRQVVEEADRHLEADDIAELQGDERAQGGRSHIDDHEKAKSDGERHQ